LCARFEVVACCGQVACLMREGAQRQERHSRATSLVYLVISNVG
jgi:hypothetical protein